MRVLMLLTLTASVLTAQTPTPAPNAAPRGSVENGKKLFVAYGCYQCHGYAAQGGASGDRGGPRIAPRPIAFAAFSKYVRRPLDQMPPYTQKLASDQDLADIYAWLLTVPEPPPVNSIPQLRN